MRTFRTDSFKDIIDAMQGKSFGQVDNRYVRTLQAKSLMALLTIKMRMQVLYHAVAGVIAHRIFQRTAAVVYAMYKVMG